MSSIINVKNDTLGNYDIVVESSFDRLMVSFDALNKSYDRICIVSDSLVSTLYLEKIESVFSAVSQCFSYVFESGEASKNLNTVHDLYGFLIENNFDRNSLLVALGGGVTGDLTGFCAATYMRGIDFIQIPTSLLSQVDSSVGGKTGVDFNSYKNMVGAFYMPKLVYINTDVLMTLDNRQFASGMAEVIKYAIAFDRDMFDFLNNHIDEINNKQKAVLEEIIVRSLKIKKRIVEEDPTEKSIRALLNFGHTIGHAVEKLKDFKLLHGECVAIGMIAALFLSEDRCLVEHEQTEAVISMIKNFRLPISVDGIRADDIELATHSDKKRIGDCIRFILIDSIGNAFIDKTVTGDEIKSASEKILI